MARLMIDHGIQLPAMVELMKQALVEEAIAQYSPADKSPTDTRIALQTGVHRKDVRRLREQETPEAVDAAMVSVAASVVARWISEPRYLQADRNPLSLARTPRQAEPGQPDFTTLVSEVSKDVGAKAVLDELERMGAVTVDDGGMASLRHTAFVPQDDLKDAFHFLADNVGDHMSAAAHNLSPDRKSGQMLEQSAFSSGLTESEARGLHRAARTMWEDALQQFLLMATAAEERSALSDEQTRQRVRFGTYFYQVDEQVGRPNVDVAQPSRRHKRKPD